MRKCLLFPVLLLSVACSSVQPLARVPQVPPLAGNPAGVAKVEPVLRADADHSPPLPVQPSADFVEPSPIYQPVTYRTVTRVVEVPAPAPEPVRETVYYPSPYERVYYEPYYRYRSHRYYRDDWFPINTAVGAGIGAIIGNQHGRRDRGALIGGAYGLLFDLHRWWR